MRSGSGRLALRSRLALLVALTVALSVAACAAVAWFLVHAQLVESLDEALRQSPVPRHLAANRALAAECGSQPESRRAAVPDPFSASVQLVDATGVGCLALGEDPLVVTAADTAVARGERDEVLHTTQAASGARYRAYTRELKGTGAALTVARPMDEIDESLDTLALVLGLVVAAGALGAAGAGVALARAGIRPVDQLTEAAEHIARTKDLGVRIPVEGEDEIARLSRSFNAMTAALASSRDLQQQLIADAGHELRTPLTSLRTNIDLLTRSEETGRPLPPRDRRELFGSVQTQMSELTSLIGDLQELSRPVTTPASGTVGFVALHEIVERAVQRARPRATETALTTDLARWYVQGEATGLERAVVNLLDNAVKFGSGYPVEVTLHDGVLRVRDRGPGVLSHELPHVFDRFWRSPTARSLPGSGLGLSIVARTAGQCGGEAELRPPEDGTGGTEALLRLPGTPTPPPGLPAL
ncbi:hypothetical protein N566_21610 [Streptomycetaceae bacterium MP113-05]|nr:hypothetical protein N566_21610 [Streptomycetaceae bacterium MP113-05]